MEIGSVSVVKSCLEEALEMRSIDSSWKCSNFYARCSEFRSRDVEQWNGSKL